MRLSIQRLLFILIALMLILQACSIDARSKEEEERMGKEFAEMMEEKVELCTDPELLNRVKRVGEILAEIANRCEVPASCGKSEIYEFDYQFKVIENEDVNAMSFPGGIVYVNTGLLDLIESDDELAGVLAHEIAHAAHHHITHIQSKQSKVDKYVALITIASVLADIRPQDMDHIILGAQMVKTAKLSSFTQDAEKDADRTAVAYLAKSPYNPQGFLDFLHKLEVIRTENPGYPLGIFQTHPAPYRRAISVSKAMKDEGLEVQNRKFRAAACAKAVPVDGDEENYKVLVGDKLVCQPKSIPGGADSKSRAEAIVERINNALDAGAKPTDVYCNLDDGSLLVNGSEVLSVCAVDARAAGESSKSLINRARSALLYAVWAEWLCDSCEEPTEIIEE